MLSAINLHHSLLHIILNHCINVLIVLFFFCTSPILLKDFWPLKPEIYFVYYIYIQCNIFPQSLRPVGFILCFSKILYYYWGLSSDVVNCYFLVVNNCWFKLKTSGDLPVGRRSHSAGWSSLTCLLPIIPLEIYE